MNLYWKRTYSMEEWMEKQGLVKEAACDPLGVVGKGWEALYFRCFFVFLVFLVLSCEETSFLTTF